MVGRVIACVLCVNYCPALSILVPSEPHINLLGILGEPNYLLVTWTAPENPNGIILNYTVYCFSDGDLIMPGDSDITAIMVVVSGNHLSVVVMELTPYTFYDCYITANTSVGEGNSSRVETAQTDESG